jgi:E3 ubiquitin-protein ligase CHFR
VPSRALEKMVDVLVRADPSHARSERERVQADDVYQGGSLRVGLHTFIVSGVH